MDALSRQKQLTYGVSDFIFNNPQTENQWTNEKYQNIDYWHPTIDRLKLRYRVPCQTRHTYASIQLTKGVNPMWVSKQMGHVTMKMLLEVYSKWIDLSDKQKELEKVNQLLFGKNFVQK
jgi:integrase